MADHTVWIQLGILLVTLAGVAVAVGKLIGNLNAIGDKVDGGFDKINFEFTKVDMKISEQSLRFEKAFDQVALQINNLKDIGNDRHVVNIERLARLEGQITALPQRVSPPPPTV